MKSFSSFVRPFSAETNSDATLANYPGCIYLLHMDDLVDGATNWTPRIGTAVISSNVTLHKDSNGVYPASTITLTPTGAMPVVTKGKYLLIISMGTPASTTHIPNLDFGDSSTGDAFKANGAVFFGGVESIAVGGGGFSGGVLGGLRQCHAGYSDWVSATPDAFRVFAPVGETVLITYRGTWTTGIAYAVNDKVTNIVTQYICLVAHTAGADFATDLAAGKWIAQVAADSATQIMIADSIVTAAPSTFVEDGSPDATMLLDNFTAVINTQRYVLGAVFVLSNPLTRTFVISMCAWMAVNPGKLYPGLRNKT